MSPFTSLFKNTVLTGVLLLAISSGFSLFLYTLVVQLNNDLLHLSPPYALLITSALILAALFCLCAFFYLLSYQQKISQQQPSPAAVNLPNARILIVDDNPANRLVIENLLATNGLAALSAASGSEAIAIYQQRSLDLIFMDIEMEELDGLKTTQIIRSIENKDIHRSESRTPIVAVSAHIESDKKYQALRAGFDDYMVKPVQEKLLRNILQRWKIIETPSILSSPISTRVSKQATSKSHQIHDSKPIKQIIDIEQSLERSNQNKDLAKDMLSLLIEMIREESPRLLAFYQQQDWENLTQLTHKLYGGSCYCGVPKLQQACKTAHSLLQKNHYTSIDPAIDELLAAMEEVLRWDQHYSVDAIFDLEASPTA